MEHKRSMVSQERNLEKVEVGQMPESIFSRIPKQPIFNHQGFPDPEVPEKAIRRKFPGDYKLRILKEAEACTLPGQLGALLRREGLYSSNLNTWGGVKGKKGC